MAWYDYIKGFFYRPPNEDKNEDVEELIEMLKSMTEDLFFSSKSDYPFEVVCWELKTKSINKKTIKEYIDILKPVEILELTPEKLLFKHSKSRPYHSVEHREKANRFKQIIHFFQSQVSNRKAFKIGKTEVQVYILGIVGNTHIIGLKTITIEN